MKKIILTSVLSIFAQSVMAETIVVIDDNGYVKQQIVMSDPSGYIAMSNPQLTIVRENPVVNNYYYYDSLSTGHAVLAGFTTIAVGSLLYNEFKHNKHNHYKSNPIRIDKGNYKKWRHKV